MSSEPFGNYDIPVLSTGLLSTVVYITPYIVFLWTMPNNKNDKLSLKERVIMHSDQSISKIFLGMEIVNAAYSFMSCVLFVWDTYLVWTPIWMFCLELSFSIFFMFNFLFLFYIARKRFAFLREPLAIVDEVTVIPVLIQWWLRSYVPTSNDGVTDTQVIEAFVRVVKMLRVFRLMRIFRSINSLVSPIDDAINSQVTLLVSTCISIVVITTGFVQVIGNFEVDEWCDDCDTLQFHDAFYFTVVTFSTVGYGDISPGGTLGRIMIVLVICLSFYLLPRQVDKLNRLMEMRSKYSGGFIPKHDKHHVVVGCSAECHGIIQFLNEFFHEDHGTQNVQVCVVVPDEPDLYWREAILKFSSKDRLTYLKGDLKNMFDCQRAKVESAQACFILVDRNTNNPHQQDSLNFMRSLAVLNYHPNMRLFVQLLEKENKQHLMTIGIRPNNIICVKEFKMGLIAQSCIVRGFSAMLGNMVASSSIEPTMYSQPWHHEYCTGMGKEIYSLSIGEIFKDQLFADVVKEIYSVHSAILFAISCGDTAIANPGSKYKIKMEDKGFILADDSSIVEDIMQSKRQKISNDTQLPRQVTIAPTKLYHKLTSLRADAVGKRSTVTCQDNEPATTNALLERKQTSTDVDMIDEAANYITRDKSQRKVSILQGLQIFRQEKESLSGHYVIITDTLEDIEHLVGALRKPHLVYRSVLIMTPLDEENAIRDEASWAAVSEFGDCYLLQGHPRNDGDLDRALVQKANTVIIVGGSQHHQNGDSTTSMDAETILAVVSIIARSNGKVRVISELNTGEHVEHYGVAQRQSLLNTRIREKSKASILKIMEAEIDFKLKNASRPRKTAYELHEVYSSGGIVLGNLTETLLCQAYFNDYIVSVVGSFLQNHMDKEGADGSSIAQIPVPLGFLEIDRKGATPTFEDLMSYMLDTHDVLVIALYRNKHHAKWKNYESDSRRSSFSFSRKSVSPESPVNSKKKKSMDEDASIVASYVVTCPLKQTEVTPNDLIFVFVKDLATYNRVTAGHFTPREIRIQPGFDPKPERQMKAIRRRSSVKMETSNIDYTCPLANALKNEPTLDKLTVPLKPLGNKTLEKKKSTSPRPLGKIVLSNTPRVGSSKDSTQQEAPTSNTLEEKVETAPEIDSEKSSSNKVEDRLELTSCGDEDSTPTPVLSSRNSRKKIFQR
mmetsp:Transcript_30427/g.40183  ORF Transcript_30427/g.40183 Transcript_30427/m.40183 type:complete len:1177 (+) Transcript_30427:302-3832(+)